MVTQSQRRVQDPQESADEPESNTILKLSFSGEGIAGPGRTRKECGATPEGEVPGDFKQLQREHPTLQEAFQKVTHIDNTQMGRQPALSGESYVLKDKLLYHQTGKGGTEHLVLAMGHKIMWVRHLSKTKSHERVAARFYWPGLYSDVLADCKSCLECQLTSARKTSPYPLQPLPVIEEHVLQISDNIEEMTDLVQKNLEQAQPGRRPSTTGQPAR